MGILQPHGRHRRRHGQAAIIKTFHGHADAIEALDKAASENRRITLITPHGASAWLGAAWFMALQKRLESHRALDRLIYDCADVMGDVLAAMRHGIRFVRADPGIVTPALVDLAAKHGTLLLLDRPH